MFVSNCTCFIGSITQLKHQNTNLGYLVGAKETLRQGDGSPTTWLHNPALSFRADMTLAKQLISV